MTPRLPKPFEAKVALPPRVPAPLATRPLLPGAAAQMKPAPAKAVAPPAYQPQRSNPTVPAAPRRTLPVAQTKRLAPRPAAPTNAGVVQRSIWQFHGDRWVMLARVGSARPPLLPPIAGVERNQYFDDATGAIGNRWREDTNTVKAAREEKPMREGKGVEILATIMVARPPLPALPPPLPAASASAESKRGAPPAPTCGDCYAPIGDEPAVVGHCAEIVFHRRCLDALPAATRSGYLFKVLVRGRPAICSACPTVVDPAAWTAALGAAEVTRLQRISAPVVVEEKRVVIADMPLGMFQCPSCGAPFLWESGCDYMAQHNEAGRMIRFHIIDNKFAAADVHCASGLGHSNNLNSLMVDVAREAGRHRDPQAAYRALLALKRTNVMAWRALGLDARLAQIEAAITHGSMQGALDAIGTVLAPAFQPLADILANYIRARFAAAEKQGSCGGCVIA